MKTVTVTFEEGDSLTNSEIISNLESAYGKNASVDIRPANNTPNAYIYHAIDEMITEEQAVLFFDQNQLYPKRLAELRDSIVKRLLYILNDVIMDNEERFSD